MEHGIKIPAFNMERQNRILKDELMKELGKIIDGGMFILGNNVKAVEEEIAAFCGVAHAIGVASGSDALYLALLACGIGPGDEVITTPFTFYATAGSIQRVGAVPVFADIDPNTWNIDPQKILEKITGRTRAILPVHLYGCPAAMDAIQEIAKGYGLHIIEDAAQAVGAACREKKTGTLGTAACFSFFPTKNLGAFGDGGMVVTNDHGIAEKVRLLRVHGAPKKYYHDLPGCNSRLDELQAAVIRLKLRHLDKWTAQRRNIAAQYMGALSVNHSIRLPVVPEAFYHVYHQFTIQISCRDELQAYLAEQGIGSTVYYPVPMHRQKVFQSLGYHEGDFPVTEQACREVLSLPMFPELTDEEVAGVSAAILGFFAQRA